MANSAIGNKQTGISLEESPSSTNVEGSLDVCLAFAGQLKEVLNEETGAITRFDSSRLLELLPLKQYLTEKLGKNLESWKRSEEKANGGEYLLLKSRLAEIKKINDSNGVFINGTLSFYEDFFRCICPVNYASSGGQPSSTKFEAPKGLTFRKEV